MNTLAAANCHMQWNERALHGVCVQPLSYLNMYNYELSNSCTNNPKSTMRVDNKVIIFIDGELPDACSDDSAQE